VDVGKFLAGLILFSTLSNAALAQGASHDGQWRVDVQTTVGKCLASATVVLTVKENKVAGIDTSGVEPWGYIDDTNTFVGHFTSGEKVLRANGDVKGDTASGPWSSQTEFCGGRWTARKVN
jgi:hypothetical protein